MPQQPVDGHSIHTAALVRNSPDTLQGPPRTTPRIRESLRQVFFAISILPRERDHPIPGTDLFDVLRVRSCDQVSETSTSAPRTACHQQRLVLPSDSPLDSPIPGSSSTREHGFFFLACVTPSPSTFLRGVWYSAVDIQLRRSAQP